MAGYFTKNNGYVFNGEDNYLSAVDAGLKSGIFVDVAAGAIAVANVLSGAGYLFKVVEVTELKGEPAVRVDCVTVGAIELFMVEAVDTGNLNADANGDLIVKKGEPVRRRRPMMGDQIIVNVASTAGIAAGDAMVLEALTGLLVKAA